MKSLYTIIGSVLTSFIIIAAWIFFDPCSNSIDGYWKTCDSSEWGGASGTCTTNSENWTEYWSARFAPNPSNNTVIKQLRKDSLNGPIQTLKNCTILDKWNWYCEKQQFHHGAYKMENGELVTVPTGFAYETVSKWEFLMFNIENWLIE